MMTVFPLTGQLKKDRYNAAYRQFVVTTTAAPYAQLLAADPNRIGFILMPDAAAEFRLTLSPFIFAVPFFLIRPGAPFPLYLDRELFGEIVAQPIFIFSSGVGAVAIGHEFYVPELRL